MYEGNGYHASRGFINVQVNPSAPPQRAMTKGECEAHVVGLILVNMYNLRKGTELFGDKADEAVMKELLEIHQFKTYKPVHKHELSQEDLKRALKSMMKISEKREDETGNR